MTDAKSVYDYLSRDGTTTSTDKRMAIEGALLREAVRRPNAYVRWIDGLQNIADVLTKAGTDKTVLHEFLRTGNIGLVQTEQNRKVKEQKQLERQRRKQVKQLDDGKQVRAAERRAKVAAEVREDQLSEASSNGSDPKNKQGV